MNYLKTFFIGFILSQASQALDCRCTDSFAYWYNDATADSCHHISAQNNPKRVGVEYVVDANNVLIVRSNDLNLVGYY